MFASSTPVFSRKRKSSGAISSPGVSPIRRYLPLPKLPKGITVQIRYLAAGESMVSLAYNYRIGKSTTSAVIRETCIAIWEALQPQVLVPPTRDHWETIAADFHRMWNFPNCVGAIDGKHVVVQCFNKTGSDFYNYKGTFSTTLMAVADAQYRFVFVSIGSKGRESDGGIFQSCNFGKAIAQERLPLPEPTHVADFPFPLPPVFLGDQAFPLLPQLMRPFPTSAALTPHQRIFNYRHCRARRVVENAFGILSSRFRIFRKPIVASVDTVDAIVQAAVVLHNWLRNQDISTGENSRAPLRNKNINQESRPASSAYEEKILPSLLNGIKPVVIQPLKKPKKEDVPVAAKSSCGSSADVANPYSNKAKKNEPHFPELIVISDSDEERQVEETIRRKTRLSVAAKRRRLTSAVEEAGDIPSLHAFLKKESRPTYSSTSSVFRASEKTQPVLTGKRCISIRLDLGPDALPGLDTKSSNAPNSTRSRTRRATRKEVVEGFGALKELKQEDTIEFAPAAEISSRTEISKFTLAGVESWKEVKDQPGAFFSKGLQAYSSGVDGDAFPARAGYLKMSVKTKMEIPSCGTNVVFTVIKGKGYLKNKTNGTDEKTEMNVGDIFVAPRGSNFSFINQATKNEFFLSYVKIV